MLFSLIQTIIKYQERIASKIQSDIKLGISFYNTIKLNRLPFSDHSYYTFRFGNKVFLLLKIKLSAIDDTHMSNHVSFDS